jgi:isoleucyl-tRNA synthetase
MGKDLQKQLAIKSSDYKAQFPKSEEQVLQYWEKEQIFEKSLAKNREKGKTFTFYDGPITSNNKPHYGHVVTMILKDLIPRYKTMKGYYVQRSLGWDCQGIPVEYEVEKALGFEEKSDIEEYGVEKFNQKCKESVQKYQSEIFEVTKRMGRWVNSEEEYATMNPKYIESIWWSLKELYKKGLLYEGYKVVPYSTRAGTTLSNSEVALGGYKTVTDIAVTVKLKLKDEDKYLLIWTTTPWTLPGNLLVAVGKEFDYVDVEYEGKTYIVGKELVDDIFGDKYKILDEYKGEDLIGKEYEPLYPYYSNRLKDGCFKVVHADHVTLEDGTGLVHQAPYGEEDFILLQSMGVEMFDYLDDQGKFTDEVKQFEGMFYKKANKYILEDLEKRDLLLNQYPYDHQMPMCWRTNTPLIYKPIRSWYVKVTDFKDKLVSENKDIGWVPEHIKEGRFGNWLEDARDWALSRNRYWGTPLPAWKCEKCGEIEVLGSFKEVEERSGVKLEDPHKPFVDKVVYVCPKCKGEMHRVDDVIDVWYDSGSMPFARFHYPFENEEKFNSKFPAEFIAEGVDQTRGWFYTLHVLGVALFDSKAFENVVVNGLVLASDGSKMSKSEKNYSEVDEVINDLGADAIRLYFLSSPIVAGQDVIFDEKLVKEVVTSAMLLYWNSVKYLLNYKEQYNWQATGHIQSDNIIDKWLLARLEETVKYVTENLDEYNIQKATNKIFDLITDISKWYIRRSRDRFVSGDQNALEILNYVLLEVSKLIAPFAPFLSETVYHTLVSDKGLESVHLEDYPEFDSKKFDQELLDEMIAVREISSLGLKIRDEKRLKLRQPLSKAYIALKKSSFQEIVKAELNVKEIEYSEKPVEGDNLVTEGQYEKYVTLSIELTDQLKNEGYINDFLRQYQNARKKGDNINYGDPVKLTVGIEDKKMKKVLEDHLKENSQELDIKDYEFTKELGEKSFKLGDTEVSVEVKKA